MKYVIVDLDGTICDNGHRVQLAQAGKWEEFHSLCHKDNPILPIVNLIKALEGEFLFLALTGRNEAYRKQTEKWMIEHRIYSFEEVIMRPDGDFRKDIDYKLEALESHFGGKEEVLKNVEFCLDDRDRVVAGMRDYGLTALQVKEGDY